MLALALGGGSTMPFIGNGVFNRPEVRAAEVPAANGVTNARSLARMYAAVVGPVEGVSDGPLLTSEQVKAAATTQTQGADRSSCSRPPFGLGFMTSSRSARTAALRRSATPGGRVGRLRRSRERPRLRLRHEPHDDQHVGRPPQPGLVAAAYDAIG
jgi:hypothetical protein